MNSGENFPPNHVVLIFLTTWEYTLCRHNISTSKKRKHLQNTLFQIIRGPFSAFRLKGAEFWCYFPKFTVSFVVNCAAIFVFLPPRFYWLHKFTCFHIEFMEKLILILLSGSPNKGYLKSLLLIKSRWDSFFLIYRTLENVSTFIIPHRNELL